MVLAAGFFIYEIKRSYILIFCTINPTNVTSHFNCLLEVKGIDYELLPLTYFFVINTFLTSKVSNFYFGKLY